MDAPVSDTAAIQNKVNLIAQKFEASGVDTVVIGGLAGANWPQYMATNPYRPKLRFLSITGARSFVTNASTTDTSVLNDSIAGGPYGPDQAIFEEPTMQACIKTLTAAGIKTPAPSTLDPTDMSNQPYQAAFNVCPVVDVLKALLEKAGKTLNYGTLTSAIDGLKVSVSGDPTPRVTAPRSSTATPRRTSSTGTRRRRPTSRQPATADARNVPARARGPARFMLAA